MPGEGRRYSPGGKGAVSPEEQVPDKEATLEDPSSRGDENRMRKNISKFQKRKYVKGEKII